MERFNCKIIMIIIVTCVISSGIMYKEASAQTGNWNVVATNGGLCYPCGLSKFDVPTVVTAGSTVYAKVTYFYDGERDAKTTAVPKKANANYKAEMISVQGESGNRLNLLEQVYTPKPPGKPTSISVPVLKGGQASNISWGSSSLATRYELERSVNSGGYTQIYSGIALNFTDTIVKGWNTVTYRVRGYNSDGYSAYNTSAIISVINNVAPTIAITNPGHSQVAGPTSGITIKGTVTDPDTQTLTISATIDGVLKSTNIIAPTTNKTWELVWTGSELNTGIYTDIPITATDGALTSTDIYMGTIIVDKVKPTMTINVVNKDFE